MYETLISTTDLARLLKDQKETTVVVDCRYAICEPGWGRGQYLKGHIPGARYADLNLDLSDPVIPGETGRHPLPDPGRFITWVQEAGISNRTQVVAYDQGGGGIAARLWWLMRWVGHTSVAVLDGGWGAWQKAGQAIEMDEPSAVGSKYSGTIHDEMTIRLEEVELWGTDPVRRLVDSREQRRYLGIEEPIDPVAGHIPGAVNFPFSDNLTGDGNWLSSEQLRERFSVLMSDKRSASDVVFYCGSGVTACHNILAFKHAGLGDARLYPGSWSEWIADRSRKVEVA